jgi:hypothetical protein
MMCWAINPYDFEFKLGIPKNLNLEFKLFFQIKMTIFDSSSSDSEVDSDFDACIRGLASLSRLNKHRNSIGRGRGRGRGKISFNLDLGILVRPVLFVDFMVDLIWNLRGINDPNTRRNAKEAILDYNISFVGLAKRSRSSFVLA